MSWFQTELETELLASRGDSSLIIRHEIVIKADVGKAISLGAVALNPVNGGNLELPLVVLLHGLGGQLNQFEYLIDHLSYFSPVLAIDLPGHGRSEYYNDRAIYTTEKYVEMVLQAINDPQVPKHKNVVFLGHSMGSHIALKAALASPSCTGVVCLAPPFGENLERLAKAQPYMWYMPSFLFNLFRLRDRQGGLESHSVKRFLSEKTTNKNILRKQLRTNLHSNTETWLHSFCGFTPLTLAELADFKVPVLVVGAANDKVTPPDGAESLAQALGDRATYEVVHDAGHGLIYERPEVVNGLVAHFLESEVLEQLSLAYQLALKANVSDKWCLKNEQKWKRTNAYGYHVGSSHLRGMKTLRESDDNHNPQSLETSLPDMVAVIDISREQPPYDPSSFKRISYLKLPTVSKIPPSKEDVAAFIRLVDSLSLDENRSAAVHCHYGFNRTGFLICCYLIERCDMSVTEAIEAFKGSRPPDGIRHTHFIDELHLRYTQ